MYIISVNNNNEDTTMDNFYHYFKKNISDVLKNGGHQFTIESDDENKTRIGIKFKNNLCIEELSCVKEALRAVAYFAKRDLCLKEEPNIFVLRLNLITMQKSFNESDYEN